MNKKDLVKAENLLADRVDRFDHMGDGKGGTALTAHWVNGGQRLFYTLAQVEEFIENRRMATEMESR